MKKRIKKCLQTLIYQGFESRYMEGSYSAKSADMFAARRSSLTSSANFPFITLNRFLKLIIQIFNKKSTE
jgi:hypothetical protein